MNNRNKLWERKKEKELNPTFMNANYLHETKKNRT